MATPAPSGGVSTPSNSAPRWGRSGDPGSAFSGLSRPGRGRGRGGPRGGRGGGRGGPPSRDPRSETDSRVNDSQSISNISTKPSAPPSTSALVSEKPVVPPATPAGSSKPKPSSRRPSRAIPPAVITTQMPTAQVPSAPLSARPSTRRKRSQSGKTAASIPPKINPPAPNANLSRPSKPRLPPVPHTAPIKDTPPHLNPRFDMRNDIDALVERVRAVAMDNRPSTPGSHIDWAGDDDDSLPDLNDWGVTPATFAASKSDVISPIIVDGLKPLPDLVSNSFPSSPLRQMQDVSLPVLEEPRPHLAQGDVSSSARASTPIPNEQTKASNAVSSSASKDPRPSSKGPSLVSSNPPNSSLNSNSGPRNPLHPSLPPKPVTAPPVSQLKLRAGATPMRPYPKSPNSATKDGFSGKMLKSTSSSEQTSATEIPPTEAAPPAAPEETTEANISIIVEQSLPEESKLVHNSKLPQELTLAEPSPSESTLPEDEASAKEGPTHAQTAKDPMEDFQVVEGLSASIHAPQAIADSVSAPANISSYSALNSDYRESSLTHTRAHTVGRPPSFPRPGHSEYMPRFTRSGHSTPRGRLQDGGYHSRTHSSPPTGSMSRSHVSRPIITGEAISRLTRTIVRTSASPTKSQTVATLGD
ncbi:hypothetical protein BDZ97DRAFT_1911920 [Flammula alnicola]|nr:hypothetical protein BDZ97DRAFT_1911920 [Flammula alnicola]